MDLQLCGKCAIVTGGTRNLGRAISLGFLQEGASVVASYREDDTAAGDFLKSVPPDRAKMLRVYKLDTSHATACRELCSIACKEFGRLDIVVNNAARIIRQPPHAITDEDFDAVFHHTLRGTLYMTRAAFETMKVNGGGRIVSMSSAGVHAGNVNELLYLCAKAGIETATRAFARLGANCGITLNAVAPHVIDSGMGQETISVDPTILNRIPLRRMGRIDELVSLVLYLSSKNCEYMTGQVVHLNGGRLMP